MSQKPQTEDVRTRKTLITLAPKGAGKGSSPIDATHSQKGRNGICQTATAELSFLPREAETAEVGGTDHEAARGSYRSRWVHQEESWASTVLV